LRPPLPVTIKKSFKRDLADSPVELPLSRLEEPLRLRFLNLRIESKMLSALPELPLKRELSLEEELPFFTLHRNSMPLRVITLTKILVSRLSERHARFLARPFAPTLELRDPSLLINSLMLMSRITDMMLPRKSTAIWLVEVLSIQQRLLELPSLTHAVLPLS
jgi:hypothetical protein